SGYYREGDPIGLIHTISDRGPNIDTGDFKNFYGKNSAASGSGKVFPNPDFCPSIYQLQVGFGSYDLQKIIKLKDRSGRPITGLSNTGTENAFDGWGNPIGPDDEALDTEGLIQLQDGTFWLAEEYGPSLVQVSANGKILDRLMPAGVGLTADYDVHNP